MTKYESYLVKFKELTKNISGNVFWKNINHQYLGGNANLLALPTRLTLRSSDNIIGKTIHDLLPTELADPIFLHDKEVMKHAVEKVVEEKDFNRQGEIAYFLSKKNAYVHTTRQSIWLDGNFF